MPLARVSWARCAEPEGRELSLAAPVNSQRKCGGPVNPVLAPRPQALNLEDVVNRAGLSELCSDSRKCLTSRHPLPREASIECIGKKCCR